MEDDEWPDSSPPYRDGKVHVLTDRCTTCVFRPGNLMHLEPGRLKGMVDGANEARSAITCHQTLEGEQAICRGYFDRFKAENITLRLAVAMSIIEEVEPPKKEEETSETRR